MDTPSVLGYELDRRTLTPVRRQLCMQQPAPNFHHVNSCTFFDFPPNPASDSSLLNDIINLSSGTLSSLTNRRNYLSLDLIHEQLIWFYHLNFNKTWETWHDVWVDYNLKYEKM
jgi:hypothetical protein